MSSRMHPSTPPSRRLSFLEPSRQRPHGVALSCKWSLTDSYPDIDKFTRGVERLFAETHFAYPTHSGRKDEWSWLSPAMVYPPTIPAEDRGRKRRCLRGKTMARPCTIFIHQHCPRLARRGAARCTDIYGKKYCIQLLIAILYINIRFHINKCFWEKNCIR